jgi:hypothetical protein
MLQETFRNQATKQILQQLHLQLLLPSQGNSAESEMINVDFGASAIQVLPKTGYEDFTNISINVSQGSHIRSL